MTNSSHPPANLKGKEKPDLPLVCSNYWPPNVALSLFLTIWYFRPFGNAGLLSLRDLPSPYLVSITQYSALKKPLHEVTTFISLTWLSTVLLLMSSQQKVVKWNHGIFFGSLQKTFWFLENSLLYWNTISVPALPLSAGITVCPDDH